LFAQSHFEGRELLRCQNTGLRDGIAAAIVSANRIARGQVNIGIRLQQRPRILRHLT
jgi:hypothetical protein